MSSLRDLYQEVIFDHSRRPRNFGALADANCEVEGHNPLCGDYLKLYLCIVDDVVADVRFEGNGCAISTASASMMTEAVKGKSIEDALRLFESVHRMMTHADQVGDDVGKLEVLRGVTEFPVRVKCATLAWHALHHALQGERDVVTTE